MAQGKAAKATKKKPKGAKRLNTPAAKRLDTAAMGNGEAGAAPRKLGRGGTDRSGLLLGVGELVEDRLELPIPFPPPVGGDSRGRGGPGRADRAEPGQQVTGPGHGSLLRTSACSACPCSSRGADDRRP
jgi:hypothetical protein